MSNSSPGQDLRRLVFVLVATAVLIVGFKTVVPSFSTWFGNFYAQETVMPAIERSHRSSAVLIAEEKFVPAARRQVPALAKGVPDRELIEMAADVCQSLDDTDGEVQPEAAASRVTGTLNEPSVDQVRRVVALVVDTVCPDSAERLSQ